jgi:hypothetical protein
MAVALDRVLCLAGRPLLSLDAWIHRNIHKRTSSFLGIDIEMNDMAFLASMRN